MLATSLHNFEKENIAKIDKNEKSIESLEIFKNNLLKDIESLKTDQQAGVLRQDEAEQSFLQSFQDIKTIVLTKLSIFDKQIENKQTVTPTTNITLAARVPLTGFATRKYDTLLLQETIRRYLHVSAATSYWKSTPHKKTCLWDTENNTNEILAYICTVYFK